MPASVSRREAQAASAPARNLQLFHVIRYDPETLKALGAAVPVEATGKAQAAEMLCGFKVVPTGPRNAIASVLGLGEAPGQRSYFRRA